MRSWCCRVVMTGTGMEYAPHDVDQRALELRLRSSALRWTIVRPNWFHQNVTEGPLRDLARAAGGTLRLPVGHAAVSFVDTRDIAAVAVRALIDIRHERREYAVTGPESLTFAELAALTVSTGAGLTAFEAVDAAEFESFARGLGWSPDYVDTLTGLFATIEAGHAADVSDDLANVLGRPGRTFGAFAAEHGAVVIRTSPPGRPASRVTCRSCLASG